MPQTLDNRTVFAFPLDGVSLIEASAGTGKTYTIANLYVRHVVAGRPVAQILVVTFTEAATEELRGRIRARLREALTLLQGGGPGNDEFLCTLAEQAGELDADQRERMEGRLTLALRSMDEAAIYTIHGFCQRMLGDFAFYSGQQFQLEVADDSDLRHQALRDWWRKEIYPLNREATILWQTSLGELTEFTAELAPLLGADRKRLLPPPPARARIDALWQACQAALTTIFQHWHQRGAELKELLFRSKGLSRDKKKPYAPETLQRDLALLEQWFASSPPAPPPPAFVSLTRGKIDACRVKKADPALADPFFELCQDAWTQFEALRLQLRVYALDAAASFARAETDRLKQRAQAMSFDDMLTRLHQALEGPAGETLSARIRQRFPVAMIDEFQDTDPVQYAIFRRVYFDHSDTDGEGDSPSPAWTMIGDPKQAIYSFRGGDIFTYIRAKRDVPPQRHYTLDTNWRSTPAMVNAVNTLFEHRGADAFVYGPDIPFAPAKPSDREPEPLTWQPGAKADRHTPPAAPALTVWTLWPPPPIGGKKIKAFSKQAAQDLINPAVAREIATLIRAGRRGQARLGETPVRPKDIAVLVRTHHEAAELRGVLKAHGVNAVSVGRDSVYHSAEAEGLRILLSGVLNPRERTRMRAALASSLLGKTYAEIHAVVEGEQQWGDWGLLLEGLGENWRRYGFMAMFLALLRDMDIPAALARGADADRRITNLLHLGELLQQASKEHPGADALLAWYQTKLDEARSEEAELRLESDADLVQIVTVHASKGLEYPIVFLPYLWNCRTREKKGLVQFHLGNETALDAGSPERDTHWLLAEQERLAEDVRLAYVALTRARARCYLVWGSVGSSNHYGQTGLAWLLHPRQSVADLGAEAPDITRQGSITEFAAELERFAAKGPIEVYPLPQTPGQEQASADPEGKAPAPIQPAVFRGKVANDWRITSFSGLTRDIHQVQQTPQRNPEETDPALAFPAGSHVGSFVHGILEHLDFQGPVEEQVAELAPRLAPRFGLSAAETAGPLGAWMQRVVHTPLHQDGMRLADLPAERRLNELEFDLSTGKVDVAALNRLLAQTAAPLRPTALEELRIEGFQGMINGIIDLVFEHGGRYFIADYKTNLLGPGFDDYTPARLQEAVYDRRYDLQYLLYTLALHRYLGQRIPGYDYETTVGGVYYLFLRGMRPETGPACGVYHHKPPLELIERLDQDIFLPAGL